MCAIYLTTPGVVLLYPLCSLFPPFLEFLELLTSPVPLMFLISSLFPVPGTSDYSCTPHFLISTFFQFPELLTTPVSLIFLISILLPVPGTSDYFCTPNVSYFHPFPVPGTSDFSCTLISYFHLFPVLGTSDYFCTPNVSYSHPFSSSRNF